MNGNPSSLSHIYDSADSYRIVAAASDQHGSYDAGSLVIDENAAVTSSNNTTFTVGSLGSFAPVASGFPIPTFSETGTLPSGVSWNSTTGTLSGTPAAGSGGTYLITFIADNGVGSDASQTFTLTVNEAPAITSPNNASFAVGASGSFAPTASGYPAVTFSETGALPNGVSWNSAMGVLSGTPATGTSGAYTVTISAHNGIGSNASQTFTLNVDQPPTITSPNGAAFTVGTSGSFVPQRAAFRLQPSVRPEHFPTV